MEATEKPTPSAKKPRRHNMKSVEGYVNPETKEAFRALAKAHGHTESTLVGLLINLFLKQNSAPQELPEATSLQDKTLYIRLTDAEKVAVSNRANERGFKPAAWVRSLIRSTLAQTPHFNDEELHELREANRQLAALGRNINQIAKTLNMSADNAHHAMAIDLKQLREMIEDHRKAAGSLVRENLKSWGVQNDEQE